MAKRTLKILGYLFMWVFSVTGLSMFLGSESFGETSVQGEIGFAFFLFIAVIGFAYLTITEIRKDD